MGQRGRIADTQTPRMVTFDFAGFDFLADARSGHCNCPLPSLPWHSGAQPTMTPGCTIASPGLVACTRDFIGMTNPDVT
jgi:hypothetical protein